MRCIELKGFTGVDDPYEEPEHPELIIETDKETVEQSIHRIFARLEELGYLESEEAHEQGTQVVAERLRGRGYL